jgi:tetratricopeptide (TPR) repeat protein
MNSGQGIHRALALAVLCLYSAIGLLVLVYWPGLYGPFLLDDVGSVAPLKSTDFSWASLLYDVTHNASGMFGRPVSVLSLVFTRIVHGPAAWGFKYHNLLLHLLIALLLFWLLLRLLPRLAPALGARALPVALTATLLWLAHPLMVSTVLYAVQRMAQLSVLFTLCALLCYVTLRESAAKEKVLPFFVGVIAFTGFLLLSVLSKENGALICLYVALIEFLAFRWEASGTVEHRRVVVFHVLFVLLPVLLGAVYMLTHLDRFAGYTYRSFDMAERAMTQLHVMVFYLKLVLLPAISDMSLFHDGWQPVRRFDLLTGILLLFWTAAALLVVVCRKRAPVLAFGVGVFLVSHLLESTILDLELVFEHRNYLGAAGLLLLPAYYAVTLPKSWKTGLLLPVITVPLFLFMTHARVNEWTNEEMIYTLAVRDHPESIRAQTAYAGIAYSKGNLDEALQHVQLAADLEPRGYSPLVIKMLYLCGRGREAEILGIIEEAKARAAAFPATPSTISSMDLILAQTQQGRCKELTPKRMVDWLQVVWEYQPNQENTMFAGYIQRQLGFFYYLDGDYVKGFENMMQAYEKTGMASILGEIIDVELRLGAFARAETLIAILDERNNERLGTEQVLLDLARSRLQQAYQRRAELGEVPSRD